LQVDKERMLAKPPKKLEPTGKPASCAPRDPDSSHAQLEKHKASATPERADAGDLTPKGLTPLPHQVQAFLFAVSSLEKNRPCYLALDAGLGKTIIAAMLANHFSRATLFYVCPPFLTANTNAEFDKWCFRKKLYLLPDSMIAKEKTLEELRDSLTEERILIVDEAHRFKNLKAKRTKALLKGILPHFKRVVFMSGTPIPNSRPSELWPVLLYAAPDIFGRAFFPYGLKYCGGFRNAYGWDFSGFTNRKEFKARLTKSFMLRQKKDVLSLPPKVEGLLTVGEGIPPVVSKVEKKILAHYAPEDLVAGKIAAEQGSIALHLATYLRLLGEYKLKYVLPYLESLLEETKENLLIFAVHKETIAKLSYALAEYQPLVITGDVPKEKRQGLVKEFQESKAHRVFIGNIQACGVGFTLTKATRVIFVEFSWVDGENSQASDRAHRIGQNESVLVQYVVLKDSFDRTRMEVLLRKRQLSI
jgi:SWI/SNF-related matrix-associated actin-dependent regulator of chromatin subfamily A-like protein 1